MRIVPFMAGILFLALPFAALAETPADQKVAVPVAAQLQKSEKLVRELFKDEFAKTTAQDKIALAQKLNENAEETKSDHASQYVLWVQAAVLAAEAADLELLKSI